MHNAYVYIYTDNPDIDSLSAAGREILKYLVGKVRETIIERLKMRIIQRKRT